MRKPSASAFTLIEMLTVLAIIVILTSMVISVGVYVMKRSALARAAGEIKMLEAACESYKSDTGSYPRDTVKTDNLNPKVDLIPTAKYAESSLFLYQELTGDKSTTGDNDLNGKQGSGPPNGIPDFGEPRYLKEFEPRILNAVKDKPSKKIISVNFFQDPFGFSYAYSTGAAKDEQTYQTAIKTDPSKISSEKRPTGAALHGFTPGGYDLWSTGGSNPTGKVTAEAEWAKWVKSW